MGTVKRQIPTNNLEVKWANVENVVRQIRNLSIPFSHMFSIFFCTEHIIHPPKLYAPQQGVFNQRKKIPEEAFC